MSGRSAPAPRGHPRDRTEPPGTSHRTKPDPGRRDRTHTYPARCLDDLVTAVYTDILAESGDPVADYRHDFRLFPCVGDLPDTCAT